MENGRLEAISERALPSVEHRIEVKGDFVSVKEVMEGTSRASGAAKAFHRS